MRSRTKVIGRAALVVSGAVLFALLGFAAARMGTGSGGIESTRATIAYDKGATLAPPAEADGSIGGVVEDAPQPGAPGEVAASPDGRGRTADALIITNSTVSVRVASVQSAIVKVRSASLGAGGEIVNMSLSAGDGGSPVPLGSVADGPTGPASATITIRVPAANLARLESEIAGLGTVLSQASTADDVTEQAIDLEARLKNLRAEEERLRGFLDRTGNVSELLEVERELARVRGEIEVMDAQLTYLTRQAARATLTVALSEPGPIAEPSGITWGFREALTRGIQVAASMITALVTIAIPVALALVLALLVYVPARIVARRRRAKREASTPVADDATESL